MEYVIQLLYHLDLFLYLYPISLILLIISSLTHLGEITSISSPCERSSCMKSNVGRTVYIPTLMKHFYTIWINNKS